MRLYHVTAIDRMSSIQEHGLVVDPPGRAWNGSKLYLTSLDDAWLWAKEIASKRQKAQTYLLLSVPADHAGNTVGVAACGLMQYGVRSPIEAQYIRVEAERLIEPDVRPIYQPDTCPWCSGMLLDEVDGHGHKYLACSQWCDGFSDADDLPLRERIPIEDIDRLDTWRRQISAQQARLMMSLPLMQWRPE